MSNTNILDNLNLENIVHTRGLKLVQSNNESCIYYFDIFITLLNVANIEQIRRICSKHLILYVYYV